MTEVRPTGGPRRPRASRFVCLAAAAALAVGPPGCAPDAAPAALSHTFESPDALARAVLTALAERDETALAAMPLSAAEFRAIVWPELPASRPEVRLPVDYAWGDLHTKSHAHLTSTLSRFGGRRLELVKVEFAGETTAYKTFTVHREAVLTVRGGDRDRPERVRLFGSVLEREGRFKLFSYVAD